MVQIKNINYSAYQLTTKSGRTNAASESQVKGFLLKVQFVDEQIGYSCLQTWPGLGGNTLEDSLRSLQTPNPTLEAKQALVMAEFEMKWRQSGKRLPPQRGEGWLQHLLVNDVESFNLNQASGFKTLKIKMSSEWLSQLSNIKEFANAGFRLRLDFNNQSSASEIGEFLKKLNSLELEKIEFVEDPFLFNFEEWHKISEQKKLDLAWDFQSGEFPQQSDFVFIHKPMREDIQRLPVKTIITSNLDHPVGQRLAFMKLLSLVEAQQISPGLTHGLNSHLIFTKTKYSEQMGTDSQFALWSEPGVGFADLLKEEAWQRL